MNKVAMNMFFQVSGCVFISHEQMLRREIPVLQVKSMYIALEENEQLFSKVITILSLETLIFYR